MSDFVLRWFWNTKVIYFRHYNQFFLNAYSAKNLIETKGALCTSGPIVSISQKLVVLPKNIQSQDSKTTCKQNLTCISQPVRANLKSTFQYETPCRSLTVVLNVHQRSLNFSIFYKSYKNVLPDL